MTKPAQYNEMTKPERMTVHLVDEDDGETIGISNNSFASRSQQLKSCMVTSPAHIRTTAVKVKLSVQFGDIEVRSYPIILGDNPSVSGGPPLTIDWDPFDCVACTLDDYQEKRGDFRAYAQMKIPKASRFELLARTTSSKEIVQRTREVAQVRKERYITATQLYKAKNDEKMEKFVRGFMNLVTNKKKKERDFLRVGKEIGAAQTLERERRNSMTMIADE